MSLSAYIGKHNLNQCCSTMQEADRNEELRSMCLTNVTEATASAKVSGSSPVSLPLGTATAKSSSDTVTLMHVRSMSDNRTHNVCS